MANTFSETNCSIRMHGDLDDREILFRTTMPTDGDDKLKLDIFLDEFAVSQSDLQQHFNCGSDLESHTFRLAQQQVEGNEGCMHGSEQSNILLAVQLTRKSSNINGENSLPLITLITCYFQLGILGRMWTMNEDIANKDLFWMWLYRIHKRDSINEKCIR